MKLRFISPTIHGIIDYSAAISLLASPLVLGLGKSSSVAFWLSIIVGVAVLLVSTNTIYKYGIFKNISFDGHLLIDLIAASIFMVIPLGFNFMGLDLYYYLANAVIVFLVVALSDNSKF